ncbi:MAG: hypothetical protein A2086_15605 [Spirochaetes bacterium GWD1_27_9]|nr:MAG: hypothetical protein A2Z98_14235 [Spirochaetes bacterium GWB1_27_13]OHD22493.1 MAG: hypothetical protein A2Y34_06740 [Spirochaetes bacterium GWC1_27_15]OHD42807.1 MAG: hypothetical protein A2086_15605 [Spirochaetes bacterium GWD1_27_9]
MKKINKAYSLLSVILVLSFISVSLSILGISFGYYQNKINKKMQSIARLKQFVEIYKKVKEYFEEDIKDNFCSPHDGWFKEIPQEIDEFKINITPEDSKIDINHLDLKEIMKDLTTDTKSTNDKDKKDYIYTINDINSLIKGKEEEYKDVFSIYMTPSLNTLDLKKLKPYVESLRMETNFFTTIEGRVKTYRGNKNYLLEPGLIIKESEYEFFRSYLPRGQEDLLYVLFDYKGSINLNFVNKKVFEIGVKICNNSKNLDIESMWKILEEKQKSSTIKDIKNVFINNYAIYEKMFSCDSKIFNVKINYDKQYFSAIIKRYKDKKNKSNVKILRTFFGKDNEK